MSTSHDHSPPGPLAPPRVVEVADRVFAYVQPDGSWWINNTGFIGGGELVVGIDTCSTEARTLACLDAVRATTGLLPSVLVNTHHHGDHTNGNGLLPPTTTIIGHERCRELMLQAGPIGNIGVWEPVDWGNIKPIPPFVTFQDRLDVHVGDLRVELHHLGPAAHTTNDVVAWIPANKVLFTGDLIFNGGTPFVLMGSVRGSLEALDRLDEFGADVLVPGHGEPCGREAIAAVRSYLTFVWETATSAHAAGESPLEAAKAVDLGDFMDLTDRERIVGNLHRAYAEIEGAAPGELIDLAVAAGDMIAFNGGRPLRCLA